jgi:RNA polymerase sigma factor (sigma-70 family)
VNALAPGDTITAMPDDGHAAAFAALADERPRFLAFVRNRVGNSVVADDILQATFARALERIDTLRDLEAAQAWFYRSLRNAIAEHYRRAGVTERRLAEVARETETTTIDEFASSPCECIDGAVESLSLNYRQAIRRVHLDGLALGEYAREAGITPGNAAVRVHRARKALEAEVRACCGRCADAGCTDCTCGSPTPT